MQSCVGKKLTLNATLRTFLVLTKR